MQSIKALPIRRQVVAFACALILPIVIGAVWSARSTRHERESELRSYAGSVASASAHYLDDYLGGLDAIATSLVHNPAVVALDRVSSDALFAAILRDQPLLLNILLTSPDGRVLGSGLPSAADVLAQMTPRPYIGQVLALGRPIVSDLLVGAVTKKPTVALAHPVRRPDGATVGVLAIGIDLLRLQTVFANIPMPEGSVVTLDDHNGRVLARSRDADRFIGVDDPVHPRDPASTSAAAVRAGLDGVERIYGSAIVSRGPWVLNVGIPASVIATGLAPSWRRNIIISAVAVATSLLFAAWITSQVARQLAQLRRAAQRIADGDFSAPDREPVAIQELAEVQEAFIGMATNLRGMRDALDDRIEEERKVREALETLQRQVVRQERLAAVGLLVSGVAHEVNNPLQAILGTAELLERDARLGAEAQDEVAFIKTQSRRAHDIIRNLSRFSSQQSGPPANVALADVITEVVQLRRRGMEQKSIALEVDIASARVVYANFTELEQVVLNFVINAQQALETLERHDGRVLIRLLDVGKRVRLEVADNGAGVKPEDEPKLFQPFFTTKPVGKGTGLGLSVSYGIIDSYGGSIGYRGNHWGGATFFFELPAVDPDNAAPPATEGGADAAPPAEHDHPSVLHRPVRS